MELTKQQIKRQDFVDNVIFELINKLIPSDKKMEWDIEAIGEIRDAIQAQFVGKFIYNLREANSIKELRAIVGGSPKTLYNKIRFADELGLLNWSSKGDYIALTKLGEQYVAAKDKYLGFKFVIQMQLHKSLKLMNYLNIN